MGEVSVVIPANNNDGVTGLCLQSIAGLNCHAGVAEIAGRGTLDSSSDIAMPLDSTAECAEPRRGLKTVSKLCALRVLRGDKSLDFQTVSRAGVRLSGRSGLRRGAGCAVMICAGRTGSRDLFQRVYRWSGV